MPTDPRPPRDLIAVPLTNGCLLSHEGRQYEPPESAARLVRQAHPAGVIEIPAAAQSGDARHREIWGVRVHWPNPEGTAKGVEAMTGKRRV